MSASAPSTHSIWRDETADLSHAVFAAQGIHCAGCRTKIERVVRALPGVAHVDVNVATSRVAVDWQPRATDLTRILKAVDGAGFRTVPLGGEIAGREFARERRAALKRIGLAGLGMMQTMMYVLGVYVAGPDGIDPAVASYLRYVGLLITTPVLLYSGQPFLEGAWRDLRARTLGMDVPVALALLLAYAASVFNTVRASGETYFDSVTMFIFFLSAGRYLEMSVRQRSLSISEAVGRSLPRRAARLRPDGSTEAIAIEDIAAGDRLSIPKGAVVPVDAQLLSQSAWIDESLLSGESTPVRRSTGEPVAGGALNAGDAITVCAQRAVRSSTLTQIVALLERAQSARPKVALVADRFAGLIVAATLVLAAAVALGWLGVDAARAFPATLAVLVVTCPCALSLATPAAVAAATTQLARLGLLVTRADALERLSTIDTVVLDKTGTLTRGTLSGMRVTVMGAVTQARVLAIAAALERASTHPIAAAFGAYADPSAIASDVREIEGRGIEGRVAEKLWRLGRPEFVTGILAHPAAAALADALYLGCEDEIAASIELGEEVRTDAAAAVESLRALGVQVAIASGDREGAVSRIAATLGITRSAARLDPQQKIAFVRQLQSQGHRTLVIGDGVNDGPVLAAADVSCAMGEGSAIAQAAADLLLLNDSLPAVARAVALARRMRSVIRQNLYWAFAYNVAAIPLAALTVLPPWAAAIGMSCSSLLVVLNARRLATPGTRA